MTETNNTILNFLQTDNFVLDAPIDNKEYEFPIPPSFPVLCRTLSEHHWNEAGLCMIRAGTISYWAGSMGDWKYEVHRDNTHTRNAKQFTYHNGLIRQVTSFVIPKPHRCIAYNINGKRCNKRTYSQFCDRHL